MKYHIALTNSTAERLAKESLDRESFPKTDLALLVQKLDASLLIQKSYPPKFIDKVRSIVAGDSATWSFARTLRSQFSSNDLIFCPGEEIGIPLAATLGTSSNRPKIAVWFHRIDGLKGRMALKLFQVAQRVDLFLVSSRANKSFLRQYLDIPEAKIQFLWHPLDCEYFQPKFQPKDAFENQTRPSIVSVGLEQRDYRLLAAATARLDVDVKVAGYSQFHSRMAAFPSVMPENMSNKQYQLPELLQLYHHADVVVISLKQTIAAAGVTALLEAMACKKPIVCVRTHGLDEYLSDEAAVMTVEPGDIRGMQTAIQYLLDNPGQAQSRAERAYQLVRQRHHVEQQVQVMTELIRGAT